MRVFGFLVLVWCLISCNKNVSVLKTDGLQFMLYDYQQRIAYFEKNGLPERAQEEKASIAAQNRAIVQYFKQEFDFCPVHFFYSSQSKDLLAGKRVLLNEQMQVDSSIPVPRPLIIAQYGIGDVTKHTYQFTAFRIPYVKVRIGPTFPTWLSSNPLRGRDVRKFNRVLKQMDEQ